MKINTIALDQPSGPKASDGPRGGNGGFQVAYARVIGDSYTPLARDAATAHLSRGKVGTPPLDDAIHTVRAGETLYAIVRARLAAMSLPANANASLQGVKQLARANNIPDPDRIYVGQTLDLTALASPSGHHKSRLAGGLDGAATAAGGIDQTQPWHGEEAVTRARAQATTELAAAVPLTMEALPQTIARDDAVAGVDAVARTPLAVRQSALYEQNASAAPTNPAEAVSALPDIVYKGIVGKVLDVMPLEPSTRTALQQANAVVSSTVFAHALGTLTGLGAPLLTVAGLIWGIFSARQIEAAATGDSMATSATTPVGARKPAGDATLTAQNKSSEARN